MKEELFIYEINLLFLSFVLQIDFQSVVVSKNTMSFSDRSSVLVPRMPDIHVFIAFDLLSSPMAFHCSRKANTII